MSGGGTGTPANAGIPFALTTLESVKASPWLVEDVASAGADWLPEWDTVLQYLITKISGDAQQYCNREFEKQEYVQYCDGGGPWLFLKNIPIASLVRVQWSLFFDWTGNFLAVPVDNTAGAAVSPVTGQVILCGGVNWYAGEKTIRVTYIGGYSADQIPGDLEGAICQQVAYDFKRRKDLGLLSLTFPDGSIQKKSSDKFLPDVKETLGHYRFRYTM
jgi:hypothetical protein